MIRKTPITCEEIVARAQANGDLVECRTCQGEGFVDTDTLCTDCGGTGQMLRKRVYVVFTKTSVLWLGTIFLVLAAIGACVVVSRILYGH
jgi:hypothetical protein